MNILYDKLDVSAFGGDMTNEPWEARDATCAIQEIARHRSFGLYWTAHARERLRERGLIISDILYVLKNGSVAEPPLPSTREGYFKYKIFGRSPNSNGRQVAVICVPCHRSKTLKLVSVMWLDEESKFAGGTNKLLEPMKRRKEKLK
ncbi:DUF4258 domain-containing protein [Thalassospira xiamenensis]|uniref:DUF4258 domain-containing protein n=1 Tax=Thalassospira xiamenensis TaxID=220697 RepID=UPI003AA7BC0D